MRFLEVEDARILTIRLDNLLFYSNKIHTNIPKYQKKKEDIKSSAFNSKGDEGLSNCYEVSHNRKCGFGGICR